VRHVVEATTATASIAAAASTTVATSDLGHKLGRLGLAMLLRESHPDWLRSALRHRVVQSLDRLLSLLALVVAASER